MRTTAAWLLVNSTGNGPVRSTSVTAGPNRLGGREIAETLIRRELRPLDRARRDDRDEVPIIVARFQNVLERGFDFLTRDFGASGRYCVGRRLRRFLNRCLSLTDRFHYSAQRIGPAHLEERFRIDSAYQRRDQAARDCEPLSSVRRLHNCPHHRFRPLRDTSFTVSRLENR